MNKILGAVSAVTLGMLTLSTAAVADGWEGDGAAAPAPVTDARKWTFSFNVGGTSDYVFRGYSQGDEDPQFQAGADVTWGILYAGVWGSGVDPDFVAGSRAEIDFYGGITPSWNILDFDFGFIYYAYPWSNSAAEADYWELKAGVSTDDLIKNLTIGATFYWSPDYTLVNNPDAEAYVVEGSLSYALPAIGAFSPTISGLVGHLDSDNEAQLASYTYWNAGLELAIEKLTFDFRYWDTDVSNDGLADERFVFTGTFTY